ncbi:MAG: hypothetical protein J6V11_02885, partial [Alphaproteobacteria bacterium]|nr:hypothetical protein [Alphaproteobacteria bacterium]
GTLAIIGVLSIGGIAGYSYGMDKHRANQTINDIMLMGVDIITQTSQKRGVPTLAEWGTKTTAGYNFTVTSNPDNNTQYGIQITGVPSRVCQMVGDALKTQATVYVGNVDYTTANTTPCETSEENTMKFYFETGAIESDGCKTDAECGENKYCDKDIGICFNGTAPEGTPVPPICTTDADCGECSDGCVWGSYQNRYYCINTQQNFGKTCTLSDGSNGMCYWGECIKTGCTYDTNKCEKGYYCSSPTKYGDCQPFPDEKTGSCVKTDFRLLKIDGKSYYVSNIIMNWWDADAACKTLGNDKKLISVSELVTKNDGSKWQNQIGSYLKTSLAEKLIEFAQFGFLNFWTENTSDDCSAYYISTSGYVNTENKGTTNFFAVCR